MPIRVSSASSVRSCGEPLLRVSRSRRSWRAPARGGRRASRPSASDAGEHLLELRGGAAPRAARPRRSGRARVAPRSRRGSRRRNRARGDNRRHLGHGRLSHEPLARRRLRLQDRAGRSPGAARRASPTRRPGRAGRLGDRRRRGRLPGERRARAGPDGRLLHADRRRPLRLRPDRGRERGLRRLRDGRPARHGPQPGRVLARAARSRGARRDPARRRRDRGGGGRSRSSAAIRSTIRSRSTGSRSPASPIPSASSATRPRGRETACS